MGGRARVAVVVDRIHDYQVSVIRGVEEVLHAADAALLVVTSPPTHNRHDNTLRRFVRAGKLQGVVITSMRDTDTQTSRVTRLAELAAGAAVVTLGITVPGVPIVLVENRGGIRAGGAHVIDDCGCTRPILVAGTRDNEDSQEREVAFLEMAAERGLVLPDPPIMYGDFDREHVYRMILRRLDAGRDFDAVLSANDDMAIGVLDALNARGVEIPGEVAVVGLDNIPEAYLTDPPLSSIDVDVVEQGRAAARLVLAQLAGQEVPAVTRPTAKLVVRSSTSSALAPQASGDPLAARASPRILAAIRDSRGDAAVRQALTDLVLSHPEPAWWQGMVAAAETTLQASDGELDAVTRNGVLRTTLLINRALATMREQRDREVLALNDNVLELNRGLASCRSLPELIGEICRYLPRLNVRRCFIVLLEEQVERSPHVGTPRENSGQARLVLSYRDGAVDPAPDDSVFTIDDLLPESLADELVHGTLTLQPLFTAERWFGIVLHEQTVIDRHSGEALRSDASLVLDAIGRARELIERASELEELVRDRTERLEREVATRRAAQEDLHEANLGLRRALVMDGLTGLQNRPSFDEHLEQAWHQHQRSREPLSVLMVDVDHFKRYNDTYGHLAGDACLREVAACLQAAVPRKQDVAARYGGEEFSVILPDTEVKGALLVASRLLDAVRAASIPHSGSDSGRVSVSIGVGSTSVGRPGSYTELLDQADQALYRAKRGGRDRAEQARFSAPPHHPAWFQ